MAHQTKKSKKGTPVAAGPPMDARWLGMFMICATQTGWAEKQLVAPSGNSEPIYGTTPATAMGLAEDIQRSMFKALTTNFSTMIGIYNNGHPRHPFRMPQLFGGPGEDPVALTPLQVFQIAAMMLKIAAGPPYKPPACPDEATIQASIAMLNIASVVAKKGKTN